MKFKKIISLLLVLTVFTGICSVSSAEELSDVEISFCVGDDTLMINGNPVSVVAPYVVGEGTTLVPVRVITEAFGAKVDWNNELEIVTITYKDTVIELAIDYDVATINDTLNIPLLAAPELYNDGYTMVPLRFISEVFGAKVGYDEETERITVSLKEGEVYEKECTIGEFSFILPPNLYYMQSYNFAAAYDLNMTGVEIVFATVPAAELAYAHPEGESLIDALAAEADEVMGDTESGVFEYGVVNYEPNGTRLFHMASNESGTTDHIYIAECGENVLLIAGSSYENPEALEDALLYIASTIDY